MLFLFVVLNAAVMVEANQYYDGYNVEESYNNYGDKTTKSKSPRSRRSEKNTFNPDDEDQIKGALNQIFAGRRIDVPLNQNEFISFLDVELNNSLAPITRINEALTLVKNFHRTTNFYHPETAIPEKILEDIYRNATQLYNNINQPVYEIQFNDVDNVFPPTRAYLAEQIVPSRAQTPEELRTNIPAKTSEYDYLSQSEDFTATTNSLRELNNADFSKRPTRARIEDQLVPSRSRFPEEPRSTPANATDYDYLRQVDDFTTIATGVKASDDVITEEINAAARPAAAPADPLAALQDAPSASLPAAPLVAPPAVSPAAFIDAPLDVTLDIPLDASLDAPSAASPVVLFAGPLDDPLDDSVDAPRPRAPNKVPTHAPNKVPTHAPNKVPIRAPNKVPTRAPMLKPDINSTTPGITKKTTLQFDIDKFLEIVANLTFDYYTNLTAQVNETLRKMSMMPTCPTLSPPPTEFDYTLYNDSLRGKCFVCGMHTRGIPYDADCADAFAGDFIPLVPQNPKAKGQIAKFRKYCAFRDVNNFVINKTMPRMMWGRWTGGCSVRWTDLSGVYTQRSCRSKYKAAVGKHYASKRMAKLEMALLHTDNGCIISPVATLLPLSRGISLFARIHACVCTGSWCNGTPVLHVAVSMLVAMVTTLVFLK